MCHKLQRNFGAGRRRLMLAMLTLASPKPCYLHAYARSQRGFALVTAIFLLVILAALGAFMVTMSTVQHTTSAQDVQGSRAYQAARAGIEWGVFQVMVPENANYGLTSGFTTQYVCPGATVMPALGGTLTGSTVSVVCTRSTYDEGDNRISVYQLSSTASFGVAGTISYIERQLTATVSTCRKVDNGENCE